MKYNWTTKDNCTVTSSLRRVSEECLSVILKIKITFTNLFLTINLNLKKISIK